MISLSDDPALLHYQGPDHRIRACRPLTPCRQAKGQGHVPEILCAAGHRFLRATRDRLRVARADFVDFARDLEDGFAAFFASASARAAWAAAKRAMATR